MKLTIFLILMSFLAATASSYSQQSRFDLKYENTTIREVFNVIKSQSNLQFFYSNDDFDVNTRVDLKVKNASIEEILDQLLGSMDVKYKIVDNSVIISKSDMKWSFDKTQQSKAIAGKVTDSSGVPLPGVTVVVKGTTQGTITGTDGKYSLINVTDNAVIVFSFVGMKTQEITVSGKSVINLVLVEEAIGLDEVVAVGYGTMKKKDFTGSVTSVTAEDISKAPVTSFDQALQGRLAGVQIISGDGQPGSLPSIIIRGNNSITGSSEPLYVVDGFPLAENDNNSINPSDIESIDVLKDASATAIYGARGANGVIMITTKRGTAGAKTVTYEGYYGFQNGVKKMDLLNPYEFVKLQLELSKDYATTNYLSNGMTLDDYKNVEAIDWVDKIFDVAPVQSHNISVSGGTKDSRFSISGSYIGQDGILMNTGFNRFQGRVTLDQTISPKLKIGLTSNFSTTDAFGVSVNGSNTSSVSASFMYKAWGYRPVQGPLEAVDLEDQLFDPTVDQTSDYRTNPLIEVQNQNKHTVANTLNGNGYAEYEIISKLKLRVNLSANWATGKATQFYNSKTFQGSPLNPQSIGVNGQQIDSERLTLSNENTLTYSKTINKYHSLTGMVGLTYQKYKGTTFGGKAVGLPNEALEISGLDEGTPNVIYSTSTANALLSGLARINYSYRSKYFITGSIRADGSSRFAKENRWGYFPSGAFKYRLSEENFMKRFEFVSDASVRVSYGATGNNGTTNDFAYLSKLTTQPFYPFNNSSPAPGTVADRSALGNQSLKWEITRQFNVGLDLSFLKNRIQFTGDYYKKITSDLLLNAVIPNFSGYTNANMNIGKVSNQGFEFVLNTVNVESTKFRWSSNFNISFNRNKVLALTEGEEVRLTSPSGIQWSNPAYIAKVGKPIALFYGAVFDGLYQLENFDLLANGTYALKDGVPSNGKARNLVQPGINKYVDLNKDGNIDAYDFTIIGDPNPDFIGGFNNTFEYAGFDLSALFQFSYGNDVLNANKITYELNGSSSNNTNMYATVINRWSPTNTNTTICQAFGRSLNEQYYSTKFIEDGSYLRLKTITLGYTLPKSLVKSVKINNLYIYTSAQNLFTWTSYSGLDPEVSVYGSRALTPSYDNSPYPRAKTIVFGVKLTL
ncbi:MAG: TonB-dependent receptor [Mangrovibacterium sp.]